MSILIVDDEDATRELCRDIALEMGLEVHTASTTSEALETLEQSPVDVVKEALHALKARKHVSVTTGAINNVMLFGARFMSRNALVNLMGRFGPHSEEEKGHEPVVKGA